MSVSKQSVGSGQKAHLLKTDMDAQTSTSQLLTLDNAALAQHMIQHRDARGQIDIIYIKDWDDASVTKQIQLLGRFR
jgi:hypothetical protein